MENIVYDNALLVLIILLALPIISLVISLLIPHEKRVKILIFLVFFLVVFYILLIIATIISFLILYEV